MYLIKLNKKKHLVNGLCLFFYTLYYSPTYAYVRAGVAQSV
jgi:hypothetical protein